MTARRFTVDEMRIPQGSSYLRSVCEFCGAVEYEHMDDCVRERYLEGLEQP